MEPGGGGAGPLPANNKARGGAAPPGKGRDLGRPPRKDSEVSAVSANATATVRGTVATTTNKTTATKARKTRH